MLTTEEIKNEVILKDTLAEDLPFCVYLTFYSGNELPSFYIGSTSTLKIDAGYNGSVLSKKYKSIWDKERQNHPELFKTEILSKHKDRKEANERERYVQKYFSAVESTDFINMAYASKDFFHGQHHSEEAKAKLSAKSKLFRHSAESKLKMSKNQKGIPRQKASEETKLKMSLSRKGKKQSPELIAKRTLAAIGKKRKPHSEETKKLLSLKNTGQVFGEQFSRNVSEGQRIGRGYDFILVKDNISLVVKSLDAFCNENHLPYSSLIACFKEKKVHKKSGWFVSSQAI
jgi:hypothetical protein